MVRHACTQRLSERLDVFPESVDNALCVRHARLGTLRALLQNKVPRVTYVLPPPFHIARKNARSPQIPP
jgi:hypothetical protein